MGKWYSGTMTQMFVRTDAKSRVVLPGHPEEQFLVRENADGSLLLEPARVVSEAQHEYDTNPDVRELLDRALGSPTVMRPRRQRKPVE